MNIILDMDQTLIDGIIYGSERLVVARPHLKKFLSWCFKTFNGVAIWTAAGKDWANFVHNKIFQQILDSINHQFDFIFTSKKCTNVWEFSEWHDYSICHKVKKLRKIHRRKTGIFEKYTIYNTLILDDTSSTYKFNYGNGIPIQPFVMEGCENDDHLLKLIVYVENILIPHFHKYNTIRNLEKRFWIDDIDSNF